MRLLQRRPLNAVALAGLLGLAAGCGAQGSVTGKVTYKDKPVANGTIVFLFNDEKGGGKVFTIDKDGNYNATGLPTGAARIAVTPPAVMKMPPAVQARLKKDAHAPQGVNDTEGGSLTDMPKSYQNPEKSGLTCEVKGGSQEHNVTIK
jgi:hypothetical protein